MKVSISLPDDDIRYLDAYVVERGLASRSAALQQAVRLLRTGELGAAYEAAWDEWQGESARDAWDSTTADGRDR